MPAPWRQEAHSGLQFTAQEGRGCSKVKRRVESLSETFQSKWREWRGRRTCVRHKTASGCRSSAGVAKAPLRQRAEAAHSFVGIAKSPFGLRMHIKPRVSGQT